MNPSRTLFLMGLAVAVLVFTSQPLQAQGDNPASLEDVHNLLKQAAGDNPDSTPPAPQQRALIAEALKEIRHIPHVYHHELRDASRDLEAALDELASGDAALKARGDILDADDLIRSIM